MSKRLNYQNTTIFDQIFRINLDKILEYSSVLFFSYCTRTLSCFLVCIILLYQLYATAQTHTDIKKATWKVKIKRKNERKGLREEVWLMWFLLKLVFASFYYFFLFSSLYSSSLHKVGRLSTCLARTFTKQQ